MHDIKMQKVRISTCLPQFFQSKASTAKARITRTKICVKAMVSVLLKKQGEMICCIYTLYNIILLRTLTERNKRNTNMNKLNTRTFHLKKRVKLMFILAYKT